MDFEEYREKYFVDPQPEQRFNFAGILGQTLYFSDYEEAVDYYSRVLGPPAYMEGDHTRGWRLGDTWLTLLRGKEGAPKNMEVSIVMKSAEEAERLQTAFIQAGGKGIEPSDQLMYEPVRSCPVSDPFGTEIMIYSFLSD